MAKLTVRKVSNGLLAAHGRAAETEHRDIPRASLLGTEDDFFMRAGALRQRLRSSVDSSETIHADRDRDAAV